MDEERLTVEAFMFFSALLALYSTELGEAEILETLPELKKLSDREITLKFKRPCFMFR